MAHDGLVLGGVQAWERVVDVSAVVPASDLSPSEGRVRWERALSWLRRGVEGEAALTQYTYWAGQTGNLDSAETLLEFGVGPSVTRALRANSAVHVAAAAGDVEALEALLAQDPACVHAVTGDGTTPLLAAVAARQIKTASHLLDHFADVEHSANNGMRPLHVAAALGDVAMVRLLLQEGADVNAKHKFADSRPLHFAAETGSVAVVGLLCEAGADAGASKVQGGTALHVAADIGQEEVVAEMARKCNLDPNALLLGDTTAVYLAAQNGMERALEALLRLPGVNVDYEMPQGRAETGLVRAEGENGDFGALGGNFGYEVGNGATAMHAAAENGHLGCVRLLLEAGASQLPSMQGATPLMSAVMYNHPEIAKLLLSQGDAARPNVRLPRDGATALFWACAHAQRRVARLLLSHPTVDPNIPTRQGISPLMAAARIGAADMVALLVERGAEVEHRARDGSSALTVAAQSGQERVVRELVERGAKVDGVGNQDRTALFYAARNGNLPLLTFLLQHKANHSASDTHGLTPLHAACLRPANLPIVQALVAAGANPLERDKEHGATPLYVATTTSATKSLAFLLSLPSTSPNLALPRSNVTLLHAAADRGDHETTTLLLHTFKAHPSPRDANQRTPLHLAASATPSKATLRTIDILLKHSPNPSQALAATDDTNATPLHIAVAQKNTAIAKHLIQTHNAPLHIKDQHNNTPKDIALQLREFELIKLFPGDEPSQEL